MSLDRRRGLNVMDPSRLDRAAIDRAVGTERRSIADLVADLDDAQWETTSLCAAWSVRDVVAHLTVTNRAGVPMVLAAAVRARGSFDRMEVDLAARRASRYTSAELVAQLRESAGSNRRTPGSKPMDPLMDLVVHAQDIARPLGVHHTSPPDVVAASLAYLAGNRFMGGSRRLAGIRVVSTDTGWSAGQGPEVRGPVVDLLLAVAGRREGLNALEGPGIGRLAAQL